jgi:hypothetical protein
MRTKSPQEKKDLKYKKERRTGSLHGYVKSYPKTKARINKASRRETNAVLRSAGIVSLENAIEVTDVQAITRERLEHSIERAPGTDYKAHPHTLKEWVTTRLEGRVRLAGDRYFAETYNSEAHRKRFGKFLQTLLSGRSAKSAEAARFYGEVLNSASVEAERYHARRRVWLRAFFKDEPELGLRLRAWIREMENLYPVG